MTSRRLFLPLLVLLCSLSLISLVPCSSAYHSATTVAFLSSAENEILAEMNLARTQPQQYADYLVEFKKYYQGSRLVIPGRRPISTFDGEAAVDEAISFLRAAQPVSALEASEQASLAAKDHATDLITHGITGHIGSDGTRPNDRVDRYAKWLGAIGEAIVYKIDSARNIVIGMIIDDGTASRGHRNDLFSTNYHFAGININDSKASSQICVITYVGGFSKSAAQKR